LKEKWFILDFFQSVFTWTNIISCRRKILVLAVIYKAYQRKGNKREEYLHIQVGFKLQLIQSWGQAH